MNGIWKKTFKRFVHGFIRFSRNKEVAKINKAVLEMANDSNLDVDEDDIEGFLETVPQN